MNEKNMGDFKEQICPTEVLESIKKHKKEWGKYPENIELSFKFKCHPRTIKRKLASLHIKGKIKIKENKNGRYNYEIIKK